MDTPIFKKLATVIAQRRPAWQFVIEDSIVRILTHQFQVDWTIITELLEGDKSLQLVEVTSHGQYGVIITMKTTDGV